MQGGADGTPEICRIITKGVGIRRYLARVDENAEFLAFIEPQELRDARILRLLPTWVGPIGEPEAGLGVVTLTAAPSASIPSMTVRRAQRGIGRYLTESKVLLLNDEADRDAAMGAVKLAGFEVLAPLADHVGGEPVFLGEPNAIGAWGNVIGFKAEVRARAISAQVALVDLDTRELFCISDELKPSILARLARMGIEVAVSHPPSPVSVVTADRENQAEKLNSKLWWYTLNWELGFGDEQRMMRRGDGASLRAQLRAELQAKVPAPVPAKVKAKTEVALRVSNEVADQLPAEIVAAFEEQLKAPHEEPSLVRSGKGSMYWESANGVLDAEDIAAYRTLAPHGVALPAEWEVAWDMALGLSAPHAPSLCALYLHDFHPDWWDGLPMTPYLDRGTWLIGHSPSQPVWLRRDLTLESERRLQCAVALIVSAVDDLTWLRKQSREKVNCELCGRAFERGMLQTGEIYQHQSSRICLECPQVGWPEDERDLTPVQRGGLLSTIRWHVEQAGGVISAGMLDSVPIPPEMGMEACFVVGRQLPGYVTNNWIEWLAESGALGESWRPSFGQISTASDGHLCRSFLERVIDDFFSANGVAHETEPPYPYDVALNQHGLRADWSLADQTMVEAAGLMASPDYAAKIERKRLLAEQHGIELIVLEEQDLPNLKEIFSSHLLAIDVDDVDVDLGSLDWS